MAGAQLSFSVHHDEARGPTLKSLLDLSTLESHLWEAANILRGPVDAADFKTYIQDETLLTLCLAHCPLLCASWRSQPR